MIQREFGGVGVRREGVKSNPLLTQDFIFMENFG